MPEYKMGLVDTVTKLRKGSGGKGRKIENILIGMTTCSPVAITQHFVFYIAWQIQYSSWESRRETTVLPHFPVTYYCKLARGQAKSQRMKVIGLL